ncbi:unnamed protein product [Prorocentrum cordatum]|uniref:Uncharacterized protein n=1 Tax=Prorocentrum cordatum TaxID=2364126 RepID=A0ABN9WF07_9DINO|nr:unnamed protein product [Polarella glacialis]
MLLLPLPPTATLTFGGDACTARARNAAPALPRARHAPASSTKRRRRRRRCEEGEDEEEAGNCVVYQASWTGPTRRPRRVRMEPTGTASWRRSGLSGGR